MIFADTVDEVLSGVLYSLKFFGFIIPRVYVRIYARYTKKKM